MKISFIALGVLLAGVAAAFVMSDIHVSYTLHVKTTVIVDTPEGIKTGSAVREIANSASSISLGWTMATNAPDIRGEAVVVDLGERGVLFALISSGTDYELYGAFPAPNGGETTVEGIKYYSSLKPSMSAALPEEYWPAFVTFTDMNDLKSVKYVNIKDPSSKKYIENVFGKGISVKKINIEITNEPITKQVEQFLPENSTSLYLGQGSFKKGEK